MSNRIEPFLNPQPALRNGALKNKLQSPPLEEAKEILREAFKRQSDFNGTPNGLTGFNIGKLLIALVDPVSKWDIQEAIKMAEQDQFGNEIEEVKKAVGFLRKMV